MPEARPALDLSLHDVMPDTLERVEALARRLTDHGLPRATLLVVPGAGWTAPGVTRLARLAEVGYPLAGHGWIHRVGPTRGLYPRLHGRLVSRHAAEHLGLDRYRIAALIRACHQWFGAHDLPVPDRYVPPAWAMGPIPRRALGALPFRYYEFARGVYDARAGRFVLSPLIGFEADGGLGAVVLRVWNRVNGGVARRAGRLRIAIHPHDDVLALRGDLERALVRWGGPAPRPVTLSA
jgi:predicted deacetylase